MMARSTALLGAIDRTEGGGKYDTLYEFSNRKGNQFEGVDITRKTIGELREFSAPNGPYGRWSRDKLGYVATPMGRYQFVGATMSEVAKRMGLDDDTVFSPEVQDAMFEFHVDEILQGESNVAQKVAELRGTWEGFKHVTPAELAGAIAQFEGGDPSEYEDFATRASSFENMPEYEDDEDSEVAPVPEEEDQSLVEIAGESIAEAFGSRYGKTADAKQYIETPDNFETQQRMYEPPRTQNRQPAEVSFFTRPEIARIESVERIDPISASLERDSEQPMRKPIEMSSGGYVRNEQDYRNAARGGFAAPDTPLPPRRPNDFTPLPPSRPGDLNNVYAPLPPSRPDELDYANVPTPPSRPDDIEFSNIVDAPTPPSRPDGLEISQPASVVASIEEQQEQAFSPKAESRETPSGAPLNERTLGGYFESKETTLPAINSVPDVTRASSRVNIEGLSSRAKNMLMSIQGASPDRSLTVTSAYRDAAHNREVGGKRNSQHISRNALDLRVNTMTPEEKATTLNAAIAGGAKGIGFYGNKGHMHVDTRATPATWGNVPGWAKSAVDGLMSGKPAQSVDVFNVPSPPDPALAEEARNPTIEAIETISEDVDTTAADLAAEGLDTSAEAEKDTESESETDNDSENSSDGANDGSDSDSDGYAKGGPVSRQNEVKEEEESSFNWGDALKGGLMGLAGGPIGGLIGAGIGGFGGNLLGGSKEGRTGKGISGILGSIGESLTNMQGMSRDEFTEKAGTFNPNTAGSGWIDPHHGDLMSYNHAMGLGKLDIADSIAGKYSEAKSKEDDEEEEETEVDVDDSTTDSEESSTAESDSSASDDNDAANEATSGVYAKGGAVGLMGPEVVVGVDPVSGNDIPFGSTAENVRDDIPARLSEGEYVIPADVVKWYGIRGMKELEMGAKMGLMSEYVEQEIEQAEPEKKSKTKKKD